MNDDSRQDETAAPELSRRTLLKTSLPVIVGAGLGLGCGGATLPTTVVSGGSAEQLAMNTPTPLTGYDVFLLRTDRGVAAISGRCPHAGCGVEPAEDGFACGCHGSTFSADGTVTQGPAGEDLTWYSVMMEGGEVMVDAQTVVAKGTFTPL